MKNFKYILFALVLKANIFNCKAQLPPSDPAYAITFGDDFNDTTGYFGNNIDTSKWLTRPPWNIGSTKTVFPYLADSANIPVTRYDTMYVAGYNLYYPKDTNNIHVIPGSPGVCRLIARRGPFLTDYYTYPFPCTSPACVGQYCFDPLNPTTSACFKPIQTNFEYSNGSLCSKRFLRYGYYEMRFRLPNLPPPDTAHNFLPTCWLFSSAYPRQPIVAGHDEIDIFEIDMSSSFPTSHYDYTSSLYYGNQNSKIPGKDSLDIKDFNPGLASVTPNIWHTGSVFWDKDSITFFYDGINTITRKNVVFQTNPSYTWHGDSLWPMRAFIEAFLPNPFIWQHPSGFGQRVDTAQMQLPFVYEIDYFNVWQLKSDCSNNKVYLNTSTPTFNSKLYKSLTVGGTGGNADFTLSGKASALGVDYVLLDEGTTIGNNIEFYAQILKCPENVVDYTNKLESSPPSGLTQRTKR